MPHTRSVSVSIYIGAGSRYEADTQAGISHFVEHMLFKGTEHRPDQALGRDVGGSNETVAAISRTMLLDYLVAQYDPRNVVISVTGDIEHQEVVDAVNINSGGWKMGTPISLYPARNGQASPRFKM